MNSINFPKIKWDFDAVCYLLLLLMFNGFGWCGWVLNGAERKKARKKLCLNIHWRRRRRCRWQNWAREKLFFMIEFFWCAIWLKKRERWPIQGGGSNTNEMTKINLLLGTSRPGSTSQWSQWCRILSSKRKSSLRIASALPSNNNVVEHRKFM